MRPDTLAAPRPPLMLLLTLTVAVWPALASASATVTFRDGVSPTGYTGTRDVYVTDGAGEAWQPNVNYNGVYLQAVGGSTQQAVLMRWDVSAIPAGATVTAASITLQVTNETVANYSFYECLRPWVDSQATWNQYATGQAWASPGANGAGDRGTTALELDPLTGATGARTFRLNASGVAVVQNWVTNPAQNHGLVVPAGTDPDGLSWYPSEASPASWRPSLSVTYSNGSSATVTFQNGAQPTTAYAGNTDTVIANGPDPRTVNNNAGWLNMDASPNHAYALVRFDLSSIPPWATVNSASLSFYVGDSSFGTFSAWEMLQPWDEATATWLEYRAGSAWAAPGAQGAADHGATLLGTFQPPSIAPQSFTLNADGVALVQAWVSGARPNYGFIIGNPTEGDGVWMADREEPTLAERPGLTIDYTEGQLVLQVAAGMAGGPFPVTVSRQRLDGSLISVLAPALDVTLATTSPTGGFSTNPVPGYPTTPTFTVQIPAGLPSSVLPVYFFDPGSSSPTVTASGGPAWIGASQVVTPVETDGGTGPDGGTGSDAGTGAPADGGTRLPGALQLGVGCGAAGGVPAVGLLALSLAAAAWLRRRAR